MTVIVVPVHNALPYVQRVVDHIEATVPADVPVVFVDDNSAEDMQQFLSTLPQKFGREISVVRNEKQQLFTRTTNRGIRLAYQKHNPEFVLILNSDCSLKPGWFEALHKPMSENEKIGLVGYTDGPHTDSGDYEGYQIVEPTGYVTGHCVLLRIEALKKTGLFCETDLVGISDPGFAPYKGLAHIGSDRFLCYAMNRYGWKTAYCHFPGVEHEAGKSWGQFGTGNFGKHDLGWLVNFQLHCLWAPSNSLTDEVVWL